MCPCLPRSTATAAPATAGCTAPTSTAPYAPPAQARWAPPPPPHPHLTPTASPPPPQDGRTYVHCSACRRCVKPTYVHCQACGRCRLPGHPCATPSPAPAPAEAPATSHFAPYFFLLALNVSIVLLYPLSVVVVVCACQHLVMSEGPMVGQAAVPTSNTYTCRVGPEAARSVMVRAPPQDRRFRLATTQMHIYLELLHVVGHGVQPAPVLVPVPHGRPQDVPDIPWRRRRRRSRVRESL